MVLSFWRVLTSEPLWTWSPRAGLSLVRARTLGLVGLPPSVPYWAEFGPRWAWTTTGTLLLQCMGIGVQRGWGDCPSVGLFSQWLSLEAKMALGSLRGLPRIFSRKKCKSSVFALNENATVGWKQHKRAALQATSSPNAGSTLRACQGTVCPCQRRPQSLAERPVCWTPSRPVTLDLVG